MAAPAPEGKGRLVLWLGKLSSWTLAAVSCAFLFGMMLLTFVDVIGRYVFTSPLPAAYEIISFMMPVLIFCALPLISRSENHVTIDLLDGIVPRAIKRPQAILVNAVGAVVVAFIGWRLYVLSGDQTLNFDVSSTLYMPLAPFSLFMSVMSFVTAVALVINVIVYAVGAAEPQSAARESTAA